MSEDTELTSLRAVAQNQDQELKTLKGLIKALSLYRPIECWCEEKKTEHSSGCLQINQLFAAYERGRLEK